MIRIRLRHDSSGPRGWPDRRRGAILGVLYAAPAIAWAAMIYVLSGTGGVDIEKIKPTLGPWSPAAFWFHFAEFGLLAGLILAALLAWRVSMGFTTTSMMHFTLGTDALLVTTAYGALDEYHQTFVPGRAAEGIDVLADFLGALTVIAMGLIIVAWHSRAVSTSSSLDRTEIPKGRCSRRSKKP